MAKLTWQAVRESLSAGDLRAALSAARKLDKIGVRPSPDDAESIVVLLSAPPEKEEAPAAAPKKKEEATWLGGSTLPPEWTGRRRPAALEPWREPDENPTHGELPKIKAKKGDKLTLKLDAKWTVTGGVSNVNKKEGTLDIFWVRGTKKDEYTWTFTKWARCNMDELITK